MVSSRFGFRKVAGLLLIPAALSLFLSTSFSASARPAPARVMGWYTGAGITNYQRFSTQAAAGANLTVAYYAARLYMDPLIERAEERGIQTLAEPKSGWIRSSNFKALGRFVRHYRDDAAVYGWYLYDEPDLNRVPASRLAAAYRFLHRIDKRPVAVVFTTGNGLFGGPNGINPAYLGSFDILMFDSYDIQQGSKQFSGLAESTTSIRNTLASAHRYHKRGVIMVEQGFGLDPRTHKPQWGLRDPTYLETRYLFWSAYLRPTLGAVFWADYHADRHVQSEVNQVMRQARNIPLGAMIYNPDWIRAGSNRVRYASASSGSTTYIVATNETGVRIWTTLRARGRLLATSFDPFEVKIFKLSSS